MVWQVKYRKKAEKQFSKLPSHIQERISKKLESVANLKNPRSDGKPLTGKYLGRWRYREGDYRIICDICDNELIILVVKVGNRKDIYKKK